MSGAFETPPGRRSVGARAAYRRALLSLAGVFVLTYLLGLRVFVWSREQLEWVDARLTWLPPELETVYRPEVFGPHRAPVDFVTYTISKDFPFGFVFFVLERVTWGPILAFLVVGVAIAVLAPRRARVAAFLDEMQFV